MFVRKKKYPSGNIGVIVAEKANGKMKELATIGVARSEEELADLVGLAEEWISKEKARRHPRLDLFGEEREACNREREEVRRVLSQVENILLNGCDLILDRTFDRVGFNRIDDEVFRKLVKARLACPASKAATAEYLKNHFDDDVDLSKIYRYLDKISGRQHELVQDISVRHTARLFGGSIGVLFYDVTTLYFEADYEDELRKTGFSKEGRHSNPQIILGLLVSQGGYPLAYCIHEGNKYEGHTMLPAITEFVGKYGLEDFVVVADSGLMNNANIAELESKGYKYIIGAKIKNESREVKQWILSQPKVDRQMAEYGKGAGRRLLGRIERLPDQHDDPRGASLLGLPQPVARRARFPHRQVQDRDTAHVPLHAPTHRSPRVHLLRGSESLQGTGTHAEDVRHQDERRQGAGTGQDHDHDTSQAPPEQGGLHTDHADGKAPENRKTLQRKFLGDTMTKSGEPTPS